MIHGKKNPGENGNSGEEVEAGREPIAEEQTGAKVEITGWMLRMTFTTVGFPCLSARVKKIVPTAEPANPEKIKSPRSGVDPRDLAKLQGEGAKR